MRALVVALALLGGAHALPAQGAGRGVLEGTLTDSVHAAPLAEATVSASRVEPGPPLSFSARSDQGGRYRIDGLPPGRYLVGFSSAFLDSLEFPRPPRELLIGQGERVRADLAIPSGRTLRAAACPGLALPRQSGAVLGLVTDAETERPLRDAQVFVAWTEQRLDSATRRPVARQLAGAVKADSLGQYRLCGVPTGSSLLLQLKQGSRIGSVIQLHVPDAAGVVVRNLSFSTAAARPIAGLDTAATPDTVTAPLSGTASLSGSVRGASGQPLAGAQVRVVSAASVARTDAAGRYALDGLPAGTQLVEVRSVGHLIGQKGVELRSGRTVTEDVRLHRIAALDSLGMSTSTSRYPEFEANRKDNQYGVFLAEDEIGRRAATEVADLIRALPAFRVEGSGVGVRVLNVRRFPPCSPNVVINGEQHQSVNLLTPGQVGAIEGYWSAAGAPTQYEAPCGLIVLWTRR